MAFWTHLRSVLPLLGVEDPTLARMDGPQPRQFRRPTAAQRPDDTRDHAIHLIRGISGGDALPPGLMIC